MKATSERDGITPNDPHLLSKIMLCLILPFYAESGRETRLIINMVMNRSSLKQEWDGLVFEDELCKHQQTIKSIYLKPRLSHTWWQWAHFDRFFSFHLKPRVQCSYSPVIYSAKILQNREQTPQKLNQNVK